MVTHAWWKEWWLTEGFASYFQAFGVEALYPKNFARQMNMKIKGQYGPLKKIPSKGFPRFIMDMATLLPTWTWKLIPTCFTREEPVF